MDREIKSLLEQKLEVMKKMLDVTKSISEVIKKDDAEELLKILSGKQQLIEEVDQIDGKLLKFFGDDKDALIKFLHSDSQAKAVNDSIVSTIKEIKALDDANLESIKNTFSKLKEDIATLKQTESALKGYGFIGGTGSRGGAFIDTKK